MRPRSASLAVVPLLLLAACGSDDSDAYLEHCEPAPDSVAGKGSQLPPRSDRLAAEAVNVVKGDPTVRKLVGGREFTTPHQIPWHSGDATGYVVTMKFMEPFSIKSEAWPVLIYAGAGRPDADSTPRLLCNLGVVATDVTVLAATVNLRSRKVEAMGFSDPASPFGGGQAQVQYEDIGSLPEDFQPVPGY